MEPTEFKTTQDALSAEPVEREMEYSDIVYDNLNEFQMALGHAQEQTLDDMNNRWGDGPGHIIVTERLMRYLAKSPETQSITYGSPGVRVYQKGAKDILDKEEALGEDDFHRVHMKKRQEAYFKAKEAKKRK